jgi:hypothetical protein
MKTEIETIMRTKDNARLSVSNWDDDGVWMHLMQGTWSFGLTLTKEEAQQLIAGLQEIVEAAE